MLKLKWDIKPGGMSPEILLAILMAREVFEFYGYDAVVTSINDGTHMAGSLHYSGNAIDLRIKNLPDRGTAQVIANKLAKELTKDYDVVLEFDHIHVESDPK